MVPQVDNADDLAPILRETLQSRRVLLGLNRSDEFIKLMLLHPRLRFQIVMRDVSDRARLSHSLFERRDFRVRRRPVLLFRQKAVTTPFKILV
jgi:hypothetical protein